MRRLTTGGSIDRARPLSFTFDDTPYTGFAGDTLASALLGAGVDVIGRSITLGRPRGIMSAGLEEATGFAQIESGGASEPLVRLSALSLYEGMAATGGVRIAKGVMRSDRDDARFDKRFAHCDLLIVGGGPAGLSAALVAARAGARVILADADFELGGSLLRDDATIDGMPARTWIASVCETLGTCPDVQVLTATTASMLMDQGGVYLAQRLGALRAPNERGNAPEQRLWHVRARRTLLATGALERPIVFQDNDRPGIMLANAARSYLTRYALAPQRGAVFTTNDDGYRTALDWHRAGVDVVAIVDPRPAGSGTLRERARMLGIPIWDSSVVDATSADARGRLTGFWIRSPKRAAEISADLFAVSGGFEPNLNLHLQHRGDTAYDAQLVATVPMTPLPNQQIAGAAAGHVALDRAMQTGADAARELLSSIGFAVAPTPNADIGEKLVVDAPSALWHVPPPDGDESRSFIDLHRDVTTAGVQRAVNAGVRHIEHVKRFTLIGTGIEQGRAAKSNAGLITAALTDRPPSDVGTSGSRPPYEPLPFHLLGGRARGERYEPVRTTSIHGALTALGAAFEVSGQWLRPSRFPRPGETARQTVARECRAARTGVAMMDASTLGKIDVRGPDAAWFLDQLYINNISAIPIGRVRYSVMCHMDGSIFDDGVVMRLSDDCFFVTTSTGHAASVVEWMEEWLQTEWPTRRVWVTPLTEQLATIAIVGPKARGVLTRVASDVDWSNDALPFLAVRHGTVAGIRDAQIARVSFSGSFAVEISVPWYDGATLWNALMSAGEEDDITPYGLDTLQALRIEKGFIIVGQDTEALTTPQDAGLSWMVSKSKDFVGKRSFARSSNLRDDRAQLVGFVNDESDEVLPEGAGIVASLGNPPMRIAGHVSSACWSETLHSSIGLALVRGGRARIGERLHAPLLDGRTIRIRLVDPVHYDPKGEHRDG